MPIISSKNAEYGLCKEQAGFSDQTVRARFVRKVFTMVSLMLGIVSLMAVIPFLHPPIQAFVIRNDWIYLLAFVVYFVVLISLMCCGNLRRSSPVNVILLVVLTLAIGFMVSVACTFHDINAVVLCLVLTTVISLSIMLFSCQTTYDFTSWIGIMFFVFFFVVVFGLFSMIAMIVFDVYWLHTIYAGLIALVSMIYMAVDTQMIIGGKKYEITPDEYIFAAILLFSNFANGYEENGDAVVQAEFTFGISTKLLSSNIEKFSTSTPYVSDVTLVFEGHRIEANKGLLSVYSPYFNTLFNGSFAEKNQSEIEIKDIDASEFVQLLEAIYPSRHRHEITDTNVECLLRLADQFQVDNIVQRCEDFLLTKKSKIVIEKKLVLAQNYRLSNLQDFCIKKYKTVGDVQKLKSTSEYTLLENKIKVLVWENIAKVGP